MNNPNRFHKGLWFFIIAFGAIFLSPLYLGAEEKGFDQLLASSRENQYVNPSLALTDIKKALEIRPDSVDALMTLGNLYTYPLNRLSDAKATLTRAEKLCVSQGLTDSALYAGVLVSIGFYHRQNGDFKASKDYSQKALNLLERKKETSSLIYASCLGNLGAAYHAQMNFSEAIKYYNQSVEVMDQLGANHTESYAATLGTVASLYLSRGDMDLAGKSFEKCLSLYRELKKEEDVNYGTYLGLSGMILYFKGEKAQAYEVLDRAVGILDKAKIPKNTPVYQSLEEYRNKAR